MWIIYSVTVSSLLEGFPETTGDHGSFLGGILLMANIRTTPPKINMSPKKGPSQKDISSSNHQFSGDMLVFWGVHHEVDV